jgi:hypothetical protein
VFHIGRTADRGQSGFDTRELQPHRRIRREILLPDQPSTPHPHVREPRVLAGQTERGAVRLSAFEKVMSVGFEDSASEPFRVGHPVGRGPGAEETEVDPPDRAGGLGIVPVRQVLQVCLARRGERGGAEKRQDAIRDASEHHDIRGWGRVMVRTANGLDHATRFDLPRATAQRTARTSFCSPRASARSELIDVAARERR